MPVSRSALRRDFPIPTLALAPLLVGAAIVLAGSAYGQTAPAAQPTAAAGTAGTDQQPAASTAPQAAAPGAATSAEAPPAKPADAGTAVTTSTAPTPKPDQKASGAAGGAAAGPAATAEVSDAGGKTLGNVNVQDTPSGMLHVSFVLKDLPAGTRAIHIHETGACDGPTFESTGGHLAGGKEHGIMSAKGPHTGDMPNITPTADGGATGEMFLSGATVADVLDGDGSAIVIHASADDYSSQPSGASGDRIACGVFTAAQ